MNPWETNGAGAAAPDLAGLLGGLLRDLAALARSTSLDRETDPRRVLPFLPAALLWRVWPRVLERAADLAAAVRPTVTTPADVEFMRHLADAIETGRPAPTVGGDKLRGVAGDGI